MNRALILGLTIVLALPAGLEAEPHPGHPTATSAPQAARAQAAAGVITSISGNNLTLRETNGSSLTVTVNARTRFRGKRPVARLSDLKVGEHVMVISRPSGSERIAETVDLLAAPGAVPSPTTKTPAPAAAPIERARIPAAPPPPAPSGKGATPMPALPPAPPPPPITSGAPSRSSPPQPSKLAEGAASNGTVLRGYVMAVRSDSIDFCTDIEGTNCRRVRRQPWLCSWQPELYAAFPIQAVANSDGSWTMVKCGP
jgi:Domain of unknown function (DUF5666)